VKTIIQLLFLLGCVGICLNDVSAQEIQIHSHNDYSRRLPFYQAYSQEIASIEADVYTTFNDDDLIVAHDYRDLASAPTLEEMYINPLVNLFKLNNGRAWRKSDKILTLLIDLKSPYNPTLDMLIAKLKEYPDVFEPEVNPYAVRIVISGNRPKPEDFDKYPSCIMFDGLLREYTPHQLERVSMISLNFHDYVQWDGHKEIMPEDYQKLVLMTETAHTLGKPIRFWGAPDTPLAWETFYGIGIDFINTDHPEACAEFLRNKNK
jgi:alkaline phosphatase